MDLLALPEASMRTFTFHGWLVVEAMSDDGLVGVGNARAPGHAGELRIPGHEA
jgi:L-alanine-DL-glutamate epimerase-like enolase superfamily enzyme